MLQGNLFNCVFFTMDPTGYIDLSEPKAQNSTVTPVDSEEVEYVLTEVMPAAHGRTVGCREAMRPCFSGS